MLMFGVGGETFGVVLQRILALTSLHVATSSVAAAISADYLQRSGRESQTMDAGGLSLEVRAE